MDHKLILETLNKYQWQKKEWNYKEATQSYYSFSNRKVALLSSDDAYVIAMGLLYKAGAYDVILQNTEKKEVRIDVPDYPFEDDLDYTHHETIDPDSVQNQLMNFMKSAAPLNNSKSDSEVTEWKIRKCNARLHQNYYKGQGYEVLQCFMEAGHKCQHWATDSQGNRINWNGISIQGLGDSDKVVAFTDDAIL